jgi:RimJ/RimL family protein N-acetyltransferase
MTVRVQPATDDDLPTIVTWLEEPETAKWLDFGAGHVVTAAAFKLGIARGTERIFIFSPEEGDAPAGIIGLSHIHPQFRTAMLWYALGDQRLSGRGLTTQAVLAVLEIAFGGVGLDAINAWTVVENRPSARILEKAGFRLIGRQRRCHYIDDRPCDRLLFDRLSNRFDGTDG